MTIDPATLPDAAIVETTAEHFAEGHTYLTKMSDVRIRGDLTVLRVLLPIPDGVPLDEAVKALAAIVPADPDADLIERVAKRLHDEADPQRLCADGFGPGCGQRAKYIERARSALDVAKAAIAEAGA